MKLALLFPGQGSQKVGMGSAMARDFEPARRVFEEADAALNFALTRLCFEGPDEDLRLTINTQPAILATSIAALRVFEAECGIMPELAAGHSLGEYGALVAAGALPFTDAVRAVRERGRLMQEACPAGQGAMAALIGLDLPAVKALCDEVSIGAELAVPANINAPDQIVISGHAAPVRKALALAKERGARASTELNVSAPFHSPLMAPARTGMEPVLARINFAPLRHGVIANVTAQINHAGERARSLLLDQITGPVRWEESMRVLAGAGATTALELGPGRVLAGLMRRIDRNVKVHGSEDTTALQTALTALATGA
jgi:[acyl-carrier-protein] S-malonyltransferase